MQLWANLNHCQAAPSRQPTASPLLTFSCTSTTWSCSPSLGVLPSLGNGVLFGLARAVLLSVRLITKEGVHSLTCEGHNRRPYGLQIGVHTRPRHTSLSSAPSCRPHFSLPCVLLPPPPAQPCCTDSCPLLLSSCLNPTKCLSKCPES